MVEHQFVRICCPLCQGLVEPPVPAAVPPGAFDPQVVSLSALLHGRYRLSAREVVAFLADLFGFDMSLGSVPAACQSVSTALAESYEQVQTAVRIQPVCWAHLVRNLRGLAERGGATVLWTEQLLA